LPAILKLRRPATNRRQVAGATQFLRASVQNVPEKIQKHNLKLSILQPGIFAKERCSRAKVVANLCCSGRFGMQSMEKLRPLALLLLRIGLGVIFISNGYPKFVGRRLEHIDEMVHINHLPAYFVYIAGVLEVGGGAMLIAGLFTRILGLLLAGEMAIAMWKGEQFFQNPMAVDKYELALALGVGAFALATFGAGSISLDRALFGKGKSPRAAKS
jgi:putative oxidoreductase